MNKHTTPKVADEPCGNPEATNPPVILDELVETVAAAMGDIMPTNLGRMTPWDKRPFEEKDLYRELARAALSASGLLEDKERMREALTKSREMAVLFLAFDGRDRHTDRMDRTYDDLSKIAVEVDAMIRTTLSEVMGVKP